MLIIVYFLLSFNIFHIPIVYHVTWIISIVYLIGFLPFDNGPMNALLLVFFPLIIHLMVHTFSEFVNQILFPFYFLEKCGFPLNFIHLPLTGTNSFENCYHSEVQEKLTEFVTQIFACILNCDWPTRSKMIISKPLNFTYHNFLANNKIKSTQLKKAVTNKLTLFEVFTGIYCHLGVLLFLSTFCCDSEERSYQTEVETRAKFEA